MYTAIIDKHPPISVVSLIFSFKNIFENIIVISGTININELAFTAPIFDDAKKYIVFAKAITTTESIKIFTQNIQS